MKNLKNVFLIAVMIFSFFPMILNAQSHSQVNRVSNDTSTISYLNMILTSVGMAPLSQQEISNFIFDLGEIIKAPGLFVRFLWDYRKNKAELCYAYGTNCDEETPSSF